MRAAADRPFERSCAFHCPSVLRLANSPVTIEPADPSTAASSSPADAPGVAEPGSPDRGALFPIVGVGASAGGLEALTQLLKALPVDTGMAYVLVQHLAPCPSALAEILSKATKMPVREVSDATTVEPDHVYVIPPDRSMTVVRGVLQLQPRAVGAMHQPVDQFFRSLAEDRQHQAIGVVLSGMAADGTLGLEAIKGEGGITFAQDQTAQHGSMPHSAIASGYVDFVLPPDEIARQIVRIGHHPHAVREAKVRAADDKLDLTPVVQLLHQATGVDFNHYKANTLFRRVTRRMVLQRMESLAAYVQYLRQTPAEVAALHQDILIGVTSFFRNPESFEAVKSQVFDRLLENRSQHEPVRIWTLGCSTGQEAYSLAIAFIEAAEKAGSPATLLLFATDLNAAAIEKARAGLYGKDIAQDVSPERLLRFFNAVEDGYQIKKSVRDACRFSQHNVLVDPPFSRLDLISCRNLLIYFELALQQKVVPMLHYALKPNGSLWLGGSETIGSYRNLFEAADLKHRIYTKNPGSTRQRSLFALQPGGAPRAPFPAIAPRHGDAVADLHREADRILLSKFAPPGVLVTAGLEILQYRGDTSPYLAPAPGKASFSLLKMLREGLLVAVRAAVLRAGKEGAPVREGGLRVKSNGGYRMVAIEVIPLQKSGAKDGGFLVLFESASDAGLATPARGDDDTDARGSLSSRNSLTAEAVADNGRLEQELAATREYLQSLIEQQEADNEELQSASEEVQSANEELQSSNEELETSKEEIQSSNEELATLNDELGQRNEEMNRVNNDLVNLITCSQTAIIMLGPTLQIRRFTPTAETMLGLVATDVGRRLTDIRLDFDNLADLDLLLADVLATATTREREVQGKQGRWCLLRLHPYETRDHKIDGVVVKLIDVDAMKSLRAYPESIVATVREPLIVLGADLRVQSASRSFYETFHTLPGNTVGQFLYEIGNHQWDVPELRRLLNDVVSHDSQFSDFEIECQFEQIGRKTMCLNARRLIQTTDSLPLILLAIQDISGRRQIEQVAREAKEFAENILSTLREPFLVLDHDLRVVTANRVYYERFGAAPDDTQGRFLYDLGNHQWGAPKLRALLHEVLTQNRALQDFEVEHDPATVDSKVMLLNASRIRQPGGESELILLAIEDITARRRLEELLRNQASVLSDLHRRKDEFLAMLSHELRNPLAAFANALQLLGLQQGSENQIQRQARGIMERQLGQVRHLVDDLLEVSRITTGRLQLRLARVDISDVVQRAVEVARPTIEEHSQQLTVALPPDSIWLDADSARLEQVLVNLLTNAAKYTVAGGHIWLTVRQDRGECVLQVRDTGVGIAPNLLPRIFDLFTQVEQSLDRSHGGLGIGLALVQRLTELHGGRVEVSSVVGQGSEFVVRLPIAPVAALQPASPVAATGQSLPRPLRVLVVDDNLDALLSLAMLLRISGHEVRTASDGMAAVQEALEHLPEVMLLDIGLPGLNGYEVAKRIRQEPSLKGVVLVALTGYGQESDRRISQEAGFDHHLVKPADFGKLEEILASVSGR